MTQEYTFDYRTREWADRTERLLAEKGMLPSHVKAERKMLMIFFLIVFFLIVTVHAWELSNLAFRTKFGIEEEPREPFNHYSNHHYLNSNK